MNVCQDGYNRLPAIKARAPGDIRHRLETLYWLVRWLGRQAGNVVELGTRGGDSTRAMLAACLDLGGPARLHSFDVEDCSGSITEPELRELWAFLRMKSVDAAGYWRKGVCDLVFVDTDHTYSTTRAEIGGWAPLVRPGGCLVFHDYWLFDPPRDENQGCGVKMAVDEFANNNHDGWRLETYDACGDGDTGLAMLWKKG